MFDFTSFKGNADFTAVTRTVNFPSTATEVFVEVPITSDSVTEDTENFAATISMIQSSVSSRVSIGEPMASVLIMDVVSKYSAIFSNLDPWNKVLKIGPPLKRGHALLQGLFDRFQGWPDIRYYSYAISLYTAKNWQA